MILLVYYFVVLMLSTLFSFLSVELSTQSAVPNTYLSGGIYIKKDYNDPSIKAKKALSYILNFFAFTPLFLLSAFRWNIGYDYGHIYVPIFNAIYLGADSPWEIGTTAVCHLIQHFTSDYIWFFAFFSFFTLLFTFLAIYKMSLNIPLSVFLFVVTGFFFVTFNAVRQCLSAALFLYSLQYIKNSKPLSYIITILLASLFHVSAICLLPIYWICKIKWTFKKQIFSIALCAILLKPIHDFSVFLIAHTRYSYYLDSNYNQQNIAVSDLFMASILLLILFYFQLKSKDDTPSFCMYQAITLLYFVFSLLSITVIMSDRILIYFRIFQIIFVPFLLSKCSSKVGREILKIFFIGMFSGITLLGFYKLNWYYVNYLSILSR